MRDRFLRRQLLQLALTTNARRPLPGGATMVPTFFGGWLTSELAPHLMAATAADTAVHLARHGMRTRRDTLGTVAAAANLAAYASLVAASNRTGAQVEAGLVDALGPDYRDEIGRTPRADDLAAPWRSLVLPFRMTDVDVAREKPLAYAPGGRRYELDVYHHRDRPRGAPVLLQVHGGAWVLGDKSTQGVPLMLHMASRGWVCVAINYPLSPRARWPEHLVAVKRALQWIRGHASDYGADPSFVAVTGGSAGGHLAAMTALTANDPAYQHGFEDVDTSVQACAPHYGVYDFTRENHTRSSQGRLDNLLRRWVMAPEAAYPDDYRAASPLYRVNAGAPPFFVVHGTNDSLVPVAEARTFVHALRAVSPNPVAYAEIVGAQHAFDVFPSLRSAAVVRGVARFLEWCDATRTSRPAAGPAAAHRR